MSSSQSSTAPADEQQLQSAASSRMSSLETIDYAAAEEMRTKPVIQVDETKPYSLPRPSSDPTMMSSPNPPPMETMRRSTSISSSSRGKPSEDSTGGSATAAAAASSSSSTTARRAKRHSYALDAICDKFGVKTEEAHLMVCEGRKVVYVLSHGNIDSLHCFHNEKPTPSFKRHQAGQQQKMMIPSDWDHVVIPNDWKVAVIVNEEPWIAQTRYVGPDKFKVEYGFAKLSEDGDMVSDMEWRDTPGAAFKAVYEKSTPNPEPGRHNGKLYIGVTYEHPQQVLREVCRKDLEQGRYKDVDAKLRDRLIEWTSAVSSSTSPAPTAAAPFTAKRANQLFKAPSVASSMSSSSSSIRSMSPIMSDTESTVESTTTSATGGRTSWETRANRRSECIRLLYLGLGESLNPAESTLRLIQEQCLPKRPSIVPPLSSSSANETKKPQLAFTDLDQFPAAPDAVSRIRAVIKRPDAYLRVDEIWTLMWIQDWDFQQLALIRGGLDFRPDLTGAMDRASFTPEDTSKFKDMRYVPFKAILRIAENLDDFRELSPPSQPLNNVGKREATTMFRKFRMSKFIEFLKLVEDEIRSWIEYVNIHGHVPAWQLTIPNDATMEQVLSKSKQERARCFVVRAIAEYNLAYFWLTMPRSAKQRPHLSNLAVMTRLITRLPEAESCEEYWQDITEQYEKRQKETVANDVAIVPEELSRKSDELKPLPKAKRSRSTGAAAAAPSAKSKRAKVPNQVTTAADAAREREAAEALTQLLFGGK